MKIIEDSASLRALCAQLQHEAFLTVDTEFLRDKTYFSKLCLLQIATPLKQSYLIDTLKDIDLAPLLDLLTEKPVLKIFHAAKQDLEIIFQKSGKIVTPLFDTQVAAMVCGYGEQIGFDSLVFEITGTRPDKSSQFTDWTRRPLSEKQKNYAADDVRLLVDVYKQLQITLEKSGREDWALEEMQSLTSPETYQINPENSWQRLKIKTAKPKDLIAMQKLASWREKEAQTKDLPRPRILKDETLLDLAYQRPKTIEELGQIRSMSFDVARGKWGKAILEILNEVEQTPLENAPILERRAILPSRFAAAAEMLKMLLKIIAIQEQVASRLIADADLIESFVQNPSDKKHPLNIGWRSKIFGETAKLLLSGKMALTLNNNQIEILELSDSQ